MSTLVLAISVICYFIANVYQNKLSQTLDGRIYPINYFQMTWMGLACVSFIVFELLSDGLQFSKSTLVLGVLSGALTIGGGMALIGAMANGPLSLTILIFSMYIVVPPVLTAIFLGEAVTLFQIVAMILIIAVFFLTNYDRDAAGKKYSRTWWLLSISSALCVGLSSYIMKVHQMKMPGLEIREYSIAGYCTGILMASVFSVFLRKLDTEKGYAPYKITRNGFIVPAAILAITQGGANLCNLYNASRLPAIILYPVSQLSTLMLTTIYGILVLKEKPTRISLTCLGIGFFAIVLMNF